MFDNIGRKIKTLAQVVCWIGIIGSVISGIVMMANDEDLAFLGFMIMVIGSLVSWVSSFALYGFGEMINQLEYSNSNSRKLYDLLKDKDIKTPVNISQPTEKTKEPQKSEHKWLCNSCGKLITQSPCPYCGNE